MKKGDILFGRKNSDAVHPIVYLQKKDKNFFFGAMLTTSSNYLDNILMAKNHFKKEGLDGEKYEFFSSNTHLVMKRLIKKEEWGPFKKVGELTNEGIEFVESKITNLVPVSWEDYLGIENYKSTK